MVETTIIAFLVAAAIALILENVPGAAQVWHKTPYKRLIVLALFLLLPVVVITAQCYGYDLHVGATCENGFSVQLVIDALVVGLSSYAGSQYGYAKSRQSGTSLRQNMEWDELDRRDGVSYSVSLGGATISNHSWNGLTDASIQNRLDELEDDLE